jgi:MoaA/NifB/PqqE/SkfB family radical SAM enzyme
MNLKNIRKIELEITSNCNAGCPGCARTQWEGQFELASMTIDDIQRLFPSAEYIQDKNFKFCGVLGDPAINKDCLEMVKYLVANGATCQLSTNGGLAGAKFWEELGQLSADTGRVDVNFCIDGHKETNHIYRVNVDWKSVERNIEAYSRGGQGRAQATWVYIVFDHNENELTTAEAHAERLGFIFATRTGMRNSLHDWQAELKKRNKETREVTVETKVITTTGAKEHSKKDIVLALDEFLKKANELKAKKTPPPGVIMMMTEEDAYQAQKEEIIKSIKCKLYHEDELFIASNMTLWPCCFLWDSSFRNKENINDKLGIFDSGWNDLRQHSIDEILAHPWFDEMLSASWDPDHPLHVNRCVRTCAYNKAYQNEFKYKDKQ